MSFPTNLSALALASVEDAHNQGAIVRVFGDAQTAQALYDADLQASGVIIVHAISSSWIVHVIPGKSSGALVRALSFANLMDRCSR
jgi:hypothetical protein